LAQALSAEDVSSRTSAKPWSVPDIGSPMQPNQNAHTGTVKSFYANTGYGFIQSDQLEDDVMFLRSDLPSDTIEVRGKYLEGRSVSFDVISGENGRPRAQNVKINVVEGEFIAGAIKSFNPAKGYGFITSSSLTEDVRFLASDLKDLPDGAQVKGELVIFKPRYNQEGRMSTERLMFQSCKIADRVKAGVPQQGGMWFAKGMGAFGKGKGMQSKGRSAHNQQKRKVTETKGGDNKRPKNVSTGTSAKGTVKSFNSTKGFGFISVDGIDGDIFFHWNALPENVSQQDLAGKAVAFTLAFSPDGKMRGEGITLC